jgi:hypothetical protein
VAAGRSDAEIGESAAMIDNQRSHLDRDAAGSARHCNSRSESGPNFARPATENVATRGSSCQRSAFLLDPSRSLWGC